jgi:alkaline phosphatase D
MTGRWLDRGTFLRGAIAGALAAVLRRGGAHADARAAALAAPDALAASDRVADPPAGVTRTWVGREFWANRIQDWRAARGRIECIEAPVGIGPRTLAVLTREIVAGDGAATLTVRTGMLAAGSGFAGFLVGAGGGALDPRAAALVGPASGAGGGLLCVYGADGRCRFREHTSERDQFALREIPASGSSGPAPQRRVGDEVELRLEIRPQQRRGLFTLHLFALHAQTGAVRHAASLSGVAGRRLLGGVSLVSYAGRNRTGTRHWFRGLATGGAKVGVRPARAVGPILGTLYSLDGSVLKLTAQLMPLGAGEPRRLRLDWRAPGGAWQIGPTAGADATGAATFRVPGWDASRAWDYRVALAPGSAVTATYEGRIRREPTGDLVVGVVNCTIHSFRPLDRPSSGEARLPGSSPLGLYTDRNLRFPYAPLVGSLAEHDPDILAVLGDQFYETRPTSRLTSPAPTLDAFGKYALWLWAFRGLTRDRPTIVLLDDHDVYQGNLWGHGGQPAPGAVSNRGGYVRSPAFVNAMQRMQAGHNPDPYDPRPAGQGIRVLFGSFRYGGVSFAMLEDRKFKSGDADGRTASGAPYPADEATLLGARQEAFLAAWAQDGPGPRVCLTQSLYACLQTTPAGKPAVDYDSNGYPAAGRRRALRLLAAAHALVVSGDQHLGSVVRHRVDGERGPVQYTVPAAGSSFQRWFEPARRLRDPAGTPHTGEFTDAFGNELRVLAVANPRVSFARFRAAYPGGRQLLGDPALKRDGYGIVRVERSAGRFVLECFPPGAGPGGKQHPGWPVTVSFAGA